MAHAKTDRRRGTKRLGHRTAQQHQTESGLVYWLACLLLLVSALGTSIGATSGTANKLSSGSFATSNNQFHRGASVPARVNVSTHSERTTFYAYYAQSKDYGNGKPDLALPATHNNGYAHASHQEWRTAEKLSSLPFRAYLRPLTRAPPSIASLLT